jgi:hypothetical protein
MADSNQENRVVDTPSTFIEGNIVSFFPRQLTGKFSIPSSHLESNAIPVPGRQFADISGLAERLMLDSTALVAKLDSINTSSIRVMPNVIPPRSTISPAASPRMVSLDRVLRDGSAIVGALSAVSLLAYALSGAIIIQPFIAIILLVSSIGFGIMSMAKS